MRIGVVDLDTSHPPNWIPLERELGHEVVGLWDGGDVHPPGYADKFAADHGVPKVFARLEDMVPEVDCAIIHGCDWDKHVTKARPFVQAGKAVLLDKPVAGKPRDLEEIRRWAASGARISGGSSLRFCCETQEWLGKPAEERGTPHTVVCGCGVDEYNYGIHAYSLMAGIAGAGAATVRHLGAGVQRRVQVGWADGRMGILVVGETPQWLPFWATIATERGVSWYQADSGRLYRALLEKSLPYLAGQTDQTPLSIDELIEPERWALAARLSWAQGDREVALAELGQDDDGYDGAAFAREYRQKRYPNGW
jgi:hypothetical protein